MPKWSMRVPIYQVDAFASALFKGNPAAVCPLTQWLPDETMQAIAAENNLAETAYYMRYGDRYQIRWFTPKVEVDLCGHATLATAKVILDIRRETESGRVVFDSQGGELTVEREGDRLVLDFPSNPASPCPDDAEITAALGAAPEETLKGRVAMWVYATEAEVAALEPNMDRLASADCSAVIATAPGVADVGGADFVSRFFAPAKGIPEDPVTGSAHTTLVPYWSRRLGKAELFARQISRRGGELWCRDCQDRVKLAGKAVLYLEGSVETGHLA